MDGINVEISVNPNDRWRFYTFVLLIHLKGRTARVNEVLKFKIKTSIKLDLKW